VLHYGKHAIGALKACLAQAEIPVRTSA
jgi:hypothetical protein